MQNRIISQQKMKKKTDWFAIAIIVFILFACVFIINMLIEYKSDSGKCLRAPFVYGAEKLEERFNGDNKVYGTIYVENEGTMYFNSTNMMAGERWQTSSNG